MRLGTKIVHSMDVTHTYEEKGNERWRLKESTFINELLFGVIDI